MTDSHEIASNALYAFSKETGLESKLLAYDDQKNAYRISLDGHSLMGYVQRWASHKSALIFQKFDINNNTLLLADYVNASVSKKLQNNGINFIDMAGNAFIDLPMLKIRIRGNRLKEKSQEHHHKNMYALNHIEHNHNFKHEHNVSLDNLVNLDSKEHRLIHEHYLKMPAERADRAFQYKGLVLTYCLLTDKKLLTYSMRDIASYANISLGTVNTVLKTLENSGFLSRNRLSHFTIVERKGLIERWVQGYAEKLGPKLLIGSFLDESPQWWGSQEVNEFNAVWGGEIAGREYTQYLQPQVATLYLPDGMMPKVMQHYRLRKAPLGTLPNIKLMQRFWQSDADETSVMASPLLTYAELIASGDPRNLETARLIHDQYLSDA